MSCNWILCLEQLPFHPPPLHGALRPLAHALQPDRPAAAAGAPSLDAAAGFPIGADWDPNQG